MNPIIRTVLFTLPAVAVAAGAGTLAVWRKPGPQLTSAIQHLAAGIVFAAAALELLPKERHEAAIPVALGFSLGLGLMIAIRYVSRRFEERESGAAIPLGLLVVTGVDLLIDGIVLGIGFAAGERTGVLLGVALTLEVLFVSLAVSSAMGDARVGRVAAALAPAGLALMLTLGAGVSRYLFSDLSPFAFAILLGIGLVALLYLVTEELLVEAHEVEETVWTTSAFFAGFLLFLLLEMWVEG
ncbi:MAG TPA: transporter [Steroidobacteraceae bacterium]|nr:transporter [Steroidobacteraceae bacterium]